MKVEQKVHHGWESYQRLKESNPNDDWIKPWVGKYQYIYSSPKGKISLVELPDYFRDGHDIWEIYCLEGDIFEDIERFATRLEAEFRVKKYLH